jgi:alkanesulfonate monooxygenase SsuD/methylene tetrahydromethanopterin reductase-like flavin-dependent oxidoreductase (luciferase family)
MSAPDPAGRRAALRQTLGPLGIWSPSPGPAGPAGDERRAFAATVERQGFPSLWIGGGQAAPDAFEQLEPLLEGSARLVVGTGIANIWAREPAGMRDRANALADRFPGRFILGLGVSHAAVLVRRHTAPG